MARRRLLTPLQWQSMVGIPHEERSLIQHYTLNREELDPIVPQAAAPEPAWLCRSALPRPASGPVAVVG